MKTFFVGGTAVSIVLITQSVPALSQAVYGAGHPRMGHSYTGHGQGYAGHGPARSQFQYRGYAHSQVRGYGVGAGVAALAAGALIGGAIASQNQGYYPDQTYPVYSEPAYVYSDAAPGVYDGGGSIAYCEQTYRSYDPSSGTYLGYDGFRHSCP